MSSEATKTIPGTVARKAAEWWADKVCGNPKQDAGIEGIGGALLAVTLAMQSRDLKPSDDARTKFVDDLAARIEGGAKLLSVDYHPNHYLSDSAKAAGILAPFPIKTVMWIDADGFSVRYGYGAEQVRHQFVGGEWKVGAA